MPQYSEYMKEEMRKRNKGLKNEENKEIEKKIVGVGGIFLATQCASYAAPPIRPHHTQSTPTLLACLPTSLATPGGYAYTRTHTPQLSTSSSAASLLCSYSHDYLNTNHPPHVHTLDASSTLTPTAPIPGR